MVSSAIADMEDFDNKEAYILGDLNFNLLDNSKYILDTKCSKVMVPWVKKYSQLCCMHNLKQLISSPSRVSKTTSTLLDHILTNSNDLVSHSGVLDIGLSDHQLFFAQEKNKSQKLTNTKLSKQGVSKDMLQKNYVINSKMLSLPITRNMPM